MEDCAVSVLNTDRTEQNKTGQKGQDMRGHKTQEEFKVQISKLYGLQKIGITLYFFIEVFLFFFKNTFAQILQCAKGKVRTVRPLCT